MVTPKPGFTPAPHGRPAESTTSPVRESMRRLPRWLQPILTELTGKPLNDEPMRVQWTWRTRLTLTLSVMLLSVVGSAIIVYSKLALLWFLLPVLWIFTTSAARSLQTTFVHHASHSNLSGNKARDSLLGEILSALVWIQPLSLYAADHRKHHGKLASADDPDLRFLVDLGLRPGLSVAAYRRQLGRMLASPKFHWTYFVSRMRANFLLAPPARRWLSVAYVVGLLALISYTQAWLVLLLAWLIPIFPLYHASGLLQLLTEHNWVRQGEGREDKRHVLARLTTGRYVGEAVPAATLPPLRRTLAWLRWAWRMGFVHAPQRLFIIPGDLPNHWYHHLQARGDWPNAAYAARDYIRDGRRGQLPYSEYWGVMQWLDATFRLLSELPTDATLGEPLTYAERSKRVLDM